MEDIMSIRILMLGVALVTIPAVAQAQTPPAPAGQPQAQQQAPAPPQQAQPQPVQQQPAQQQPVQQTAMAEQCLADLGAYSQRLNQEQFWVTGWGNRWGVGEPAMMADGVAAGGMAAPWGAVQGDLRSPRAQIRQLYGAAYVLAQQGDEDGCQYLVQILDRTYQGYAEQLSAAGLQPAQITDWRQEQLALAQPVREMQHMQRMTVDDITGADVRNAQDQSLGSVSDITINAQTGEITYAIIARGGFLGIGTDHVAVPWEQFRATAGLNTLVLDVTPEALDQAPSVDPDNFGDPTTFAQQNEAISRFWSQPRT